MLNWISTNAEIITILIALIPIFWGIKEHFSIKLSENRQRRFEIYHELIKNLVEREDEDRPKMLDRQLAIVFELQNFKEYYPSTLKILKGLRESWKGSYGPETKNARLIEQMDETINKIENSQKGWFKLK